jgi:hypothetical protein
MFIQSGASTCDCGYDFTTGKVSTPNGQSRTIKGVTKRGAGVKGALFSETDYLPFMLGVFIVGGLIAVPFFYGAGLSADLGLPSPGMRWQIEYFLLHGPYFKALPWSLASCLVYLISFRRNGTITWARAVPAMAAMIIAVYAYYNNTGKPAFAVGGFLGFILIMVCGYVGIAVARLTARRK